jgi:hypothetical protein
MPGRSHLNLFNKDTRDLFMLCIVFMCQLYCVLFTVVVHLFCSLFDFHSIFCSTFVLIRFFCFSFIHCSLFKSKRFNSDPRLYSRYFDPVVHEVPLQPLYLLYKKYHHHLCKSINIIHQTAPTLS